MHNSSKIYSPDNRFAWVEINLKNLARNFKLVEKYIKIVNNPQKQDLKPKIMAIVKANAYGHGLVEISKKAIEAGASWLGVALVQEGMRLRNAGIKNPILCLGSHAPEKIRDAVENDITLSVTSLENAKIISDLCLKTNIEARVHIKIDTGMNRIGINYKEAIRDIMLISKMSNIRIEGVFTHFACASEKDDSYTLMQWDRFNKIMTQLKLICPEIKTYHCANSAAFVRYPYMHLDIIRLGIIIYGINPFGSNYNEFCSSAACSFVENLQPVLSLKARISFVKKVPEGEFISYRAAFKTKRNSIIATIPVGYADGYSWNFSNKSYVIYNECFAPIAGNVTMDQSMIDITDCTGAEDAKAGDEVILIGSGSDKTLKANELADLIGTISYEIVCMIGDRIPRIYI